MQKAKAQRTPTEFYADLGKIVVEAEWLNQWMRLCCQEMLHSRGLPTSYAITILAGSSLENTRRIWLAVTKHHFEKVDYMLTATDMLANRIDSVIRRRNAAVHGLWAVEPEIKSMKIARELRGERKGGFHVTSKTGEDFAAILDELKSIRTDIFAHYVMVSRGQFETLNPEKVIQPTNKAQTPK